MTVYTTMQLVIPEESRNKQIDLVILLVLDSGMDDVAMTYNPD